jgi:formylglycine-generating enzyme required for sulfatase activity
MANNDPHNKPCCTPQRDGSGKDAQDTRIIKKGDCTFELCDIPGGDALVGTDRPVIPLDEEGPCRTQAIEPFRMMQTVVSNEMFARFIDDTNYKTDAERFGWSFVFLHQLPDDFKATQARIGTEWWRKVDGANWRDLLGPNTDYDLPGEHPVVHVSWNDAKAFAKWAGGDLPTEAQWEHAARGGLGDVAFPWGEQQPNDTDYQPCNIWQGEFPNNNECKDGFAATAPTKSFSANGYGLYNMCGNVWEWTSGRLKINGRSKESQQYAKHFKGAKLLKGGSFLCHNSYCLRYRIAARTGNTPDSSTTHQGFRLVFNH